MQKVIFLVLSIAVWHSSGQPEECISKSKYYIPNFTVNWHKAVEHCHYLGMRLAIIPNEDVQSEVVEAFKTSDKFNANAMTTVWIGASDLAQESIFHWHATGRRVQYTNWNRGNPDNLGQENCVELRYKPAENWAWNNRNCGEANYFVCQKVEPVEDNMINNYTNKMEEDAEPIEDNKNNHYTTKMEEKAEPVKDSENDNYTITLTKIRPLPRFG